MKRTLTIAAICSFLLSAGAAEIVLAAPGYAVSDGEIAVPTLPMAVEAAVALAGRRPELKEITVECKEGVYDLASPVVISKSPAVPLVIRPAKGAKVAFDGGLRLAGWKKTTLNGRDALVAKVPSDATVGGQLPRLYVNGRPAVPASVPKKPADAFKAKEIGTCDTENMSGVPYVVPDPRDFPAAQRDIGNVHLLAIDRWNAETRGELSYDAESGRIVIHANRNFPPTTRFVFLNVREALLEKGEYCYDKTKGEITYIPRDGESAETMDARIPRVSALLVMSGTPEQPVSGITFRDISFRHGGLVVPELGKLAFPELQFEFSCYPVLNQVENGLLKGRISYQAGIQCNGTVVLEQTRNCAFENCVFENSNQYGLVVNNGCSRISVSGCEFTGLGGGGIAVHGSNFSRDPESYYDATSGIVITDNHVHDCGLVYPETVGILITNASGNLVEHNHVHDLRYSGISCGWNWGYDESSCRENRIGFNLVHDVGQGVMSDMGGIYLLGIQPGTRVYNNIVHHVAGRLYGGWGIYLDEGSSHIVVERNICHDNGDDGFHLHFGRENVVRDNIFALNRLRQFTISDRNDDLRYANPGTNLRAQASVYRNLLITDGKPFFKMSWPKCFSREALYSDSNFYWSTNPAGLPGAAVTVPHAEGPGKSRTYSLHEWQGFGHDTKSCFEDPLVADIGKRDFRLKQDSPLLKAGFPDTAETIGGAGVREKN